MSNGLPRTCTSVTLTRPIVTCSGRAPEISADSPAARVRRTATVPLASVTSTQDSPRARIRTRPVATGAALVVASETTAAAEAAGFAAVARAGAATTVDGAALD